MQTLAVIPRHWAGRGLNPIIAKKLPGELFFPHLGVGLRPHQQEL